MTVTNICILIAIIVYLLLVLAIGVAFMKKNETTDDFYLGGRKLGPFVTAMSAEASDMSSYLLMGIPGVAYATGLADAAWTAIGLAIGTYLNWLLVAKRLRKYSVVAGNAVTLPEFFANRYHDKKKLTSIIAAIIIIVFFVPYTASGFSACGKLFSTLFGMNYLTAMIISAVVIVTYTTLGGFLAASTSDFIQSIVMTIAIIITMVFGVVKAGGVDAVLANAHSIAGYFSLVTTHSVKTDSASSYGFITIISTLAWGLGYFGMPHILLRFMASKDSKQLTLSRRIATIWAIISMGVAIAIGIVGNAMVKAGVIEELADPEKILISIAQLIAEHGVFAALVAGVILAGILAATMSTADSQLLAASSSASQDILKGVFWKNMSDKAAIVAARVTVIVMAVIAIYIARDPENSVFVITSFAWAGFGAAFGPAVLFSLFWKRTNLSGVLAGMISGGVTVFAWKFLLRPLGGNWDIYELLPAFIVSSIFIVAVSLLTKAPDDEIVKEFERVKNLAD